MTYNEFLKKYTQIIGNYAKALNKLTSSRKNFWIYIGIYVCWGLVVLFVHYYYGIISNYGTVFWIILPFLVYFLKFGQITIYYRLELSRLKWHYSKQKSRQ